MSLFLRDIVYPQKTDNCTAYALNNIYNIDIFVKNLCFLKHFISIYILYKAYFLKSDSGIILSGFVA